MAGEASATRFADGADRPQRLSLSPLRISLGARLAVALVPCALLWLAIYLLVG